MKLTAHEGEGGTSVRLNWSAISAWICALLLIGLLFVGPVASAYELENCASDPSIRDLASCANPEGRIKNAVIAAQSVVQNCEDHSGNEDLFYLQDEVHGDKYTVRIWTGILTDAVRVSWNVQIPRTHRGVNSYFYRDGTLVKNTNHGETAMTGGCGGLVGNALDSDFGVKMDFGGTDVTVSHSEGKSTSHTVKSKVSSTFKVKASATGVSTSGSATVSYSESTTVKVTEKITVTTQGYKHVFEQKGYENPPDSLGEICNDQSWCEILLNTCESKYQDCDTIFQQTARWKPP